MSTNYLTPPYNRNTAVSSSIPISISHDVRQSLPSILSNFPLSTIP